jgi:hypothetical protein
VLSPGALPHLRDESGSIVVVAGIIVVAFALLAGGMLQIGDWLQHRRHAQMRVDAAALAGGQLFSECFDPAIQTGQAQSDIEAMAKHYMGFASSVSGAPLNTQFGGGSDQYAFQSKTYPDGTQSDDTDTRGECTNMQLDVKLQDSNIPSLMKLFPGTTIHAHARVEAQTIQQFQGSFPLAIPDVQPKYMAVTFVNEATGSELTGCSGALVTGTTCTYSLCKQSTCTPPPSDPTPTNTVEWWSAVSPTLPAASPTSGVRVGIRVGMGAVPQSCAGLSGNQNWSCFDASDTSIGGLMIRDYSPSGTGSPKAPILRAVTPSNSCWAAFSSSPFVSDRSGATTCSVGVSANIDFGTGNSNPSKPASQGGVKATVTATINGNNVNLCPVSYQASDGTWLWTPGGTCTGSASIPVDATASTSSYPVTISWTASDGPSCSKKPCSGNFDGKSTAVMRFTSADDANDGPIKAMAITSGGGYSMTSGSKTFNVGVWIQSSLGVTNPPVLQALRVSTTTRGNTTAVACDGTGDSNLVNAVVKGCTTPYQINNNDICPDPNPPAGPADCVATEPGNKGVTLVNALNTRLAGCPPNNWPDYTKPGDPRLIVMMITDFSAYNATGRSQVPVVNFGAFYVIGWSGNACGATWPFPYPEPNSGANIWGYFVKYASLDQVPSGQVCDPTQITPCVPVLVR